LDGGYPGATNRPGSRDARVTNWPPLAVTAIGMWDCGDYASPDNWRTCDYDSLFCGAYNIFICQQQS